MLDVRDKRVFVAGASGVIGQALCRLLVEDGWSVTGTTRSAHKLELLGAIGVEPLLLDALDAGAVLEQVLMAQPEVLVHQLTDLPDGLDPAQMTAALPRNARLRQEGTRNLVAAAAAAGVKRMVAQSIAFAYAPGPTPYREEAPLNLDHSGPTAPAVASLEQQVLAGPFEGVVLRYGKFYGPGTGFDDPASGGPVHVEAAADATRKAMTRGAAGIYNIAEEDGAVSSAKAVQVLGWDPLFRLSPPIQPFETTEGCK